MGLLESLAFFEWGLEQEREWQFQALVQEFLPLIALDSENPTELWRMCHRLAALWRLANLNARVTK